MSLLKRRGVSIVSDRDRDPTQFLQHDVPVDLDTLQPAGRPTLPPTDVVAELQNITKKFGERKLPDNIPKALKDIIDKIKDGQLGALQTIIDAVRGSDNLITEILKRYEEIVKIQEAHCAHMEREKKIASKLDQKYRNMWADIQAELDKEEQEQGA